MSRKTAAKAYTLRIELQNIEPLVWRRLLVDGDTTLVKLHHYIQAAMGWTDAHLHEFEIDGKTYATPHPEDDAERELVDERRVRLDRVAAVGDHFAYLYDFGDSWQHRIVVERVESLDEEQRGYAYISAGERACPPEDVGGAAAYVDFMEQISQRPLDEEGRRLLQWAGEDFDPARFDRHAANAALLRMAWNRWA